MVKLQSLSMWITLKFCWFLFRLVAIYWTFESRVSLDKFVQSKFKKEKKMFFKLPTVKKAVWSNRCVTQTDHFSPVVRFGWPATKLQNYLLTYALIERRLDHRSFKLIAIGLPFERFNEKRLDRQRPQSLWFARFRHIQNAILNLRFAESFSSFVSVNNWASHRNNNFQSLALHGAWHGQHSARYTLLTSP